MKERCTHNICPILLFSSAQTDFRTCRLSGAQRFEGVYSPPTFIFGSSLKLRMISRLFDRTSSESSNRLDIDNDIEKCEENPHRAHDRRSRSLSITPNKRHSKRSVSWPQTVERISPNGRQVLPNKRFFMLEKDRAMKLVILILLMYTPQWVSFSIRNREQPNIQRNYIYYYYNAGGGYDIEKVHAAQEKGRLKMWDTMMNKKLTAPKFTYADKGIASKTRHTKVHSP
ncbi:hypothetical protein M3Y94_00503100 [Aphelenchoides besseyi]|nr:hypothetical protein M3Y94_00503100 [Aphelenchoides besseyi]KAI6217364.1 hypothetical protein M3Y95_01222900 [Aphelenchoides besseyi]